MKIVGKKMGTFTDKDGKQISYCKLFVTEEFPVYAGDNAPYVEGLEASAISVNRELLRSVSVGDEVIPIYNRYGKISSFEL